MAKSKVTKKAKKAAKKTKRPYNRRGPKSFIIPIINLVRNIKGGKNLRISAHNISFTPLQAIQLGVAVGDYMLIGRIDDKIYLGKKPKGVFGGHPVLKNDAAKSSRLSLKSKFTEDYGLPTGEYTIGKSFKQTIAAEDGEQIPYDMWELKKA